jgi:hypothetical protein
MMHDRPLGLPLLAERHLAEMDGYSGHHRRWSARAVKMQVVTAIQKPSSLRTQTDKTRVKDLCSRRRLPIAIAFRLM